MYEVTLSLWIQGNVTTVHPAIVNSTKPGQDRKRSVKRTAKRLYARTKKKKFDKLLIKKYRFKFIDASYRPFLKYKYWHTTKKKTGKLFLLRKEECDSCLRRKFTFFLILFIFFNFFDIIFSLTTQHLLHHYFNTIAAVLFN